MLKRGLSLDEAFADDDDVEYAEVKSRKIIVKKEKISLTIDAQVWKDSKHYCIDNNLEYSSFVEQLIRDKLKKQK